MLKRIVRIIIPGGQELHFPHFSQIFIIFFSVFPQFLLSVLKWFSGWFLANELQVVRK